MEYLVYSLIKLVPYILSFMTWLSLKYKIRFTQLTCVNLLIVALLGCNDSEIRRPWSRRIIPFTLQNQACKNDPNSSLRQIFTFRTDTSVRTFIEYWHDGNKKKLFHSDTSSFGLNHRIVVWGLKPECDYSYRIVTTDNKFYTESEVATFKTSFLPVWVDSYYTYSKNAFKINGKLLISNRKDPGMLVLLDSEGNIVWYNAFTKFLKTAWYTQNNTFLFILSDPGYKTTYGNHLLEMNLKGDTLVHFRKESPGFAKTFHHETLLDKSGNIVVLTAENRKFDLSKVGGSKNDSITVDGIQIFSTDGKKLWEWTVFDVEDPLKDSEILKTKSDWLHANSMCFDNDSNFLVSFYNINQIWKINSKSGKLIWKFGEHGDIVPDQNALFSGQHTLHKNQDGSLMMFDNGTKAKRSRALSFTIDEQQKTAKMIINAPLPDSLYTEKMGSAFLLDKTTILQCSTNKNYLLATDLNGKIFWKVKTGGLTYRAQFIPEKSDK